jgi:hypothetical protein
MIAVYAMIKATNKVHALFGTKDFARSFMCQNPDQLICSYKSKTLSTIPQIV